MNKDLILVEKYDEFLKYIYPKLQQIPKNHGILKTRAINLVFEQPEIFYKAIKSNHISKLYEADASLASIRHMIRFLSSFETVVYVEDKKNIGKKIRKNGKFLLDKTADRHASLLLVEVGKILGAAISSKQKRQ